MDVQSFRLKPHKWVPNNAGLPVVLYRGVLSPEGCETVAHAFEDLFRRHGWPPQWRDGIYDYHHYHSTAHEVLGIASGAAQLTIGGPGGRVIEVSAGDALLLPVGTGHCCCAADKDFLVVGAYPEGQDWDICRDAPDQAKLRRIGSLPLPPLDPVLGQKSGD
jgi:uncharacterized protein YjlB